MGSGPALRSSAVLVQTGDVTDRGPDSLEVIELMIRLEAEAAAAGGEVVALVGNHEVMNVTGELDYVSPEEIERVRRSLEEFPAAIRRRLE